MAEISDIRKEMQSREIQDLGFLRGDLLDEMREFEDGEGDLTPEGYEALATRVEHIDANIAALREDTHPNNETLKSDE